MMKPLQERLNDRLEPAQSRTWQNGQRQIGFILPEPGLEHDQEIDELVVLARRLQAAPQLQVDPDFAWQLERRMLRRHTELRLKRSEKKRSFFSLLRAHPAFGIILGLCFLVLLLSSSVLALAAQTSNPNNPLYAVKRWEQQLQISLVGNAGDQAALNLQFARDSLNALPYLTDPVHATAYSQALTNLDQQLNTAAAAINALPAGSQRNQLTHELASLKLETIHTLRGLLAQLALPARLATTDELARLGESVPHLINGTLTLPDHPNGRATINLSGSNIQPGAQLLVDGKPVGVTGVLQNNQITFVLNWNGLQHPHTLGILNPDGTVAQTTTISVKTTSTNGGSPKNGNGDGKNHNGGNGSGGGNKPSVTPTPHKPSVTPTPHHQPI
jgi:hypothetical protein